MERNTGTLKLMAICCCALLCSAVAAVAVRAEEQAQPARVSIYHLPPEAAGLPNPQEPLQLAAQLLHTKEKQRPMNALVVIDGKLSIVPVTKVFLNKYDRPEYTLQVHAPFSEISYQFVLYQEGQPALLSERYTVQRPCRLDTSRTAHEIDTNLQGQERLDAMIEKLKLLEVEINAYDHALEMLAEITKLMKG